MKGYKRLPLKGQIMLFSGLIVLVSILILSAFVANSQATGARDHLAEKVRISASHIAHSEMAKAALVAGETNDELKAYVETVREENDLQYIVVMDNDRIRYTHPVAERIGQMFVGEDAADVFNGHRYTSEGEGTLGPSMRAFEPVWDEAGNQIGAVSVGISTEAIAAAVKDSQSMLLWSVFCSLLIGIVGASMLGQSIKKTLNGLEPAEIALAVEERNSMLEAVDEGILAINNDSEVLLANNAAKQFLRRTGYHGEFDGVPIDRIWPELKLPEALTATSAFSNESIKKGDVETVATRVPMYVAGECVGALATFNERSHLDDVMRRLAGAEVYAHSLRSETHEFMNKLHIIHAMVETESYEELTNYIEQLSERYHKRTASAASQVEQLVEDVSIAHYLAQKIGWIEQMGVSVQVQSGTPWPSMNTALTDVWVTVIGNTFDNAWEAMQHKDEKKLTLTLKQAGGVLRYVIEDNGIGFSPTKQEASQRSTKGGDRGYGLANIREKLKPFHGTIDILSEKGEGTIVTIHIPYGEKGGNSSD
ncbi:ATP-binding protein [Bacillus sp. FSL K6-0047]